MIFLGLHFDQAQGMFVQQPVLLIGLLGIAPFAVRRPILAVGTSLSYLAVLLPNSFHDCWYGCYSFGGRFMWSVIALWFLPLAASTPASALLVAVSLWRLRHRWCSCSWERRLGGWNGVRTTSTHG